MIELPVPEAASTEANHGLLSWHEAAHQEPVPATEPDFAEDWRKLTPVDRQVLVLSRVVQAHQQANRLQTLGNVKAEKIIHLIESHAGVDLERAARKEAAGPADFPRLKKVAHRAGRLYAFSVIGFSDRSGGRWMPQSGLGKRAGIYEQQFAKEKEEIERIIALMVPMDTDRAEIVATLYACWNDRLAQGATPTDDEIIADFYAWPEGKVNFEAERVRRALEWMRSHALVPSGRARPVAQRDTAARSKPKRARKKAGDEAAYAALRQLLEARGTLTSADAQAATGLSAAQVRGLLKRLVDEGHAVSEGQRRGMKYRKRESGV